MKRNLILFLLVITRGFISEGQEAVDALQARKQDLAGTSFNEFNRKFF